MDQLTIANITGLFPHKTEDLPKISQPGSRPSYTSLRLFQDQINENAMAIPSSNTKLGHLGLVEDNATYKAVTSNKSWTVPTDPGNAPKKPTSTNADNLYATQETIRSWQYKNNQKVTTYLTRKALQAHILENVDNQFVN